MAPTKGKKPTSVGNIVIENARLIFRNFAGKEGKFNAAGRRNFCVVIPEESVAQIKKDGWNVKTLKAREEGDPDISYIQVTVSYKTRPPKIVLIKGEKQVLIGEDAVDLLDWAEIINADVSLRPYEWEVQSKSGLKAYLKTLYVTSSEDEFESKYGDPREE